MKVSKNVSIDVALLNKVIARLGGEYGEFSKVVAEALEKWLEQKTKKEEEG